MRRRRISVFNPTLQILQGNFADELHQVRPQIAEKADRDGRA